MNLSLFFPPEAVAWLMRYGLFTAEAIVAGLFLSLLLRPLWMWYTGQSEVLERLKRLDENARKALFELEMLNETLTIPVKRAAQKAKAAEKAEAPLVVSEATKADFLKALEKSRTRILSDGDGDGDGEKE
jgi:hypothetical protein